MGVLFFGVLGVGKTKGVLLEREGEGGGPFLEIINRNIKKPAVVVEADRLERTVSEETFKKEQKVIEKISLTKIEMQRRQITSL